MSKTFFTSSPTSFRNQNKTFLKLFHFSLLPHSYCQFIITNPSITNSIHQNISSSFLLYSLIKNYFISSPLLFSSLSSLHSLPFHSFVPTFLSSTKSSSFLFIHSHSTRFLLFHLNFNTSSSLSCTLQTISSIQIISYHLHPGTFAFFCISLSYLFPFFTQSINQNKTVTHAICFFYNELSSFLLYLSHIHRHSLTQTLIHLYLSNNQIGDAGMTELSQALRDNKVTTTTITLLFFIFLTFIDIHSRRHSPISTSPTIKLEMQE